MTLAPGARILVHAVVERQVGSTIEARIGDQLVELLPADLAEPCSETLMWCGRPWSVLGRTERETWLRHGHLHLSVPHDLIDGTAEDHQPENTDV